MSKGKQKSAKANKKAAKAAKASCKKRGKAGKKNSGSAYYPANETHASSLKVDGSHYWRKPKASTMTGRRHGDLTGNLRTMPVEFVKEIKADEDLSSAELLKVGDQAHSIEINGNLASAVSDSELSDSDHSEIDKDRSRSERESESETESEEDQNKNLQAYLNSVERDICAWIDQDLDPSMDDESIFDTIDSRLEYVSEKTSELTFDTSVSDLNSLNDRQHMSHTDISKMDNAEPSVAKVDPIGTPVDKNTVKLDEDQGSLSSVNVDYEKDINEFRDICYEKYNCTSSDENCDTDDNESNLDPSDYGSVDKVLDHTPEITFEGSDLSDNSVVQDYLDNMSDLDDDQIFALANQSVHQYEDYDVLGDHSNHEEFDDYFDKLLSGGISSTCEKNDGISSRRKMKRRERQLLHINGFNKMPPLWNKYRYSMSIREIYTELKDFAVNHRTKNDLLRFPPLGSSALKAINVLASHFKMKSSTCGSKKLKYVVVSVNKKTRVCGVSGKVGELLNFGTVFFRPDCKDKNIYDSDKMDELHTDTLTRSRKLRSSERIRDGHVVGHNASEIDQSNFGHRLMKMMGWTEGSGLGKERAGIITPICATVKLTKVGLGG